MRENEPLLCSERGGGGEEEEMREEGTRRKGRARKQRAFICFSCLFLAGIAALIALLAWSGWESVGWWGRQRLAGKEMTGDEDRAALMDLGASPCEDFYQYACGGFLKKELPRDHDQWYYSFDGVKERDARIMRSVLMGEGGGDTGKLFRSCLDTESIDAQGIRPVQPYMRVVDSAVAQRGEGAFVELVAMIHRLNSKAFFFWDVGTDVDSLRRVMYLQQGGLTLADHTFYLLGGHREKREALKAFAREVFVLLGYSQEESRGAAESILEVEVEIAGMFLSHAQERRANSLPPLSFGQVAKGMRVKGGGFDWLLFFRRLGVHEHLLQSEEKVRDLSEEEPGAEGWGRCCGWWTWSSSRSCASSLRGKESRTGGGISSGSSLTTSLDISDIPSRC
eukprot:471276-Hanusia_phi.AAC.2